MPWRDRRYSPWLLAQEEQLMRRREQMNHSLIAMGIVIALAESLIPWGTVTPDIPALVHIAVAALSLPLLYFMLQGDYRLKLQAFTVDMSDRARRLFFLDRYLNLEQFELQERMQGALLMPTQRAIEGAVRLGNNGSLSSRVLHFYRNMPSKTFESDRLGFISIGHPRTAISWGIAIALAWTLFPPFLPLPMMGMQIGTSQGLSVLPLLLLVYLYAARANTRFAFENALYDWLRLG